MADHMSGLTPQSKQIVDQYIQWERLAREKLRRDVKVDAAAFQSGNLLMEHYTKAEVHDVLSGQLQVLLSTLDREGEFHDAATAELVRAVLRDADRQRVILDVNAVDILSNVSGVQGMNHHIQQIIGGPRNRLAPLSVADAGGEAGKQLAEANAEIQRLRGKLRQITDQYTEVMSSRSLDNERAMLSQDEVQRKQREVEQLALQQQAAQSSLQQQVQEARAELLAAKRELNTRLSQSTQYQQLKRLLTERNEQVRTLRSRLAAFDPSYLQDTVGDGDVAVEDD